MSLCPPQIACYLCQYSSLKIKSHSCARRWGDATAEFLKLLRRNEGQCLEMVEFAGDVVSFLGDTVEKLFISVVKIIKTRGKSLTVTREAIFFSC